MLGKLPNGWVKTSVGEICLPVATIQPEGSLTEFTYFDIGGIDNERNRVAETKTVTGRNASSRARQALRKDDILFPTVRTYLRKIARVERDHPFLQTTKASSRGQR
jgi:type I restriction enzyme, S subunit